jgi:FKBP-type peptidyl-prolyl cis-trans isomerase
MRNQLGTLALMLGLTLLVGLVLISNRPSPQTAQDYSSQPEGFNTNTPTANAPAETGGELKVETTKQGSGDKVVKEGDIISVHYRGTLADGTEFDNSFKRGQPYQFQIGYGNVIRGWDEGLLGMKVGEKRKLTIPASYGYRNQAVGSIPPNSTLYFETELMTID